MQGSNNALSVRTPIWAYMTVCIIGLMFAILGIISSIFYFQGASSGAIYLFLGAILLVTSLGIGVIAGIGIAQFVMKREILLARFALGVGALYCLSSAIINFSLTSIYSSVGRSDLTPMITIFGIVYAASAILIFVSVLKFKENGRDHKVLDYAFGGSALFLLLTIVDFIVSLSNSLASTIQILIYLVAVALALMLLLGCGLTQFKPVTVKAETPSIFSPESEKKVIGKEETNTKSKNEELESLILYKELLDKGIITQEEFDAKKKEILG